MYSRSKRNSLDFTTSQSSYNPREPAERHHQHWIQLRVFNLPFLAALAVVFLFITIAIGTSYSYLLYSINCPTVRIYQLSRTPTSTHNTHSLVCGSTLPYFARKSNFFNQNFVKLGWAWTSLAVWVNLIFSGTPHTNHPGLNKELPKKSDDPRISANIHHTLVKPNHLARSMALYCTATTLWIFFTQWFFGSSLIDRLLVLTGAKCIVHMVHIPHNGPDNLKVDTTQLSGAYCDQRRWGQYLPGLDRSTMAIPRPYWSGGMDLSGHCLLLSLSILMIISTLTPSIQRLWFSKPISTAHRICIYANLTLVGSWWWMLLMTSLYFHEPVEKFAGLVVGVGAWWTSEMVADKLMGSDVWI